MPEPTDFQSLLGFILEKDFSQLQKIVYAFNPFWDLSNIKFFNSLNDLLNSFNPFWDLSFNSLKLTRPLIKTLSIPFGIYQQNKTETNQQNNNSFQSLLGFISIFYHTENRYGIVSFNPFWDLSTYV